MQISWNSSPFFLNKSLQELQDEFQDKIETDPNFLKMQKEGRINAQGVFLGTDETPLDITRYIAEKLQKHLDMPRKFMFNGVMISYTNMELLGDIDRYTIVGSSIISEFLKDSLLEIIPWLEDYLTPDVRKRLFKKREDVDYRIQLLSNFDDLYSRTNRIIDLLQEKVGSNGNIKEERGLSKLGGGGNLVMAGVDDLNSGMRQEFIFHLFDLKNPYLSTQDNLSLEVDLAEGKVVKVYLKATGRPWEEAVVHQVLNIFHLLNPENLNKRSLIKILSKKVKGSRCLPTKLGMTTGEEVIFKKIENSKSTFEDILFNHFKENNIDDINAFFMAVSCLQKLYELELELEYFLIQLRIYFSEKELSKFAKFIGRLLFKKSYSEFYQIMHHIDFTTFQDVAVYQTNIDQKKYLQIQEKGNSLFLALDDDLPEVDLEDHSILGLETTFRMRRFDCMIQSISAYLSTAGKAGELETFFHFYEKAGLAESSLKTTIEKEIPYHFAYDLLNTEHWQKALTLWRTLPLASIAERRKFIKKLLSISSSDGIYEIERTLSKIKDTGERVQEVLALYPFLKDISQIDPIIQKLSSLFEEEPSIADGKQLDILIQNLIKEHPSFAVLELIDAVEKAGLFPVSKKMDWLAPFIMACCEMYPGLLLAIFDIVDRWGGIEESDELKDFFAKKFNMLSGSKEVRSRRKKLFASLGSAELTIAERKLVEGLYENRSKKQKDKTLMDLKLAYQMGEHDLMVLSFPAFYQAAKREGAVESIFEIYEEASLFDPNLKETPDDEMPYRFALYVLNTDRWETALKLWRTLSPDASIREFIEKLILLSPDEGIFEIERSLSALKERREQVETIISYYPLLQGLPFNHIKPIILKLTTLLGKRLRGTDEEFSQKVDAIVRKLVKNHHSPIILSLINVSDKAGFFSVKENSSLLSDYLIACHKADPDQLFSIFDLAMQWGFVKKCQKLMDYFVETFLDQPESGEGKKRKEKLVELIGLRKISASERRLVTEVFQERRKLEEADSLCLEIYDSPHLLKEGKFELILSMLLMIKKLETFLTFLNEDMVKRLTEEHIDYLHHLGLGDFLKSHNLKQVVAHRKRYLLCLEIFREKKEVLELYADHFQKMKKNSALIRKVVEMIDYWEEYIPGFNKDLFIRVLIQNNEVVTTLLIIESFQREEPLTEQSLISLIPAAIDKCNFVLRNHSYFEENKSLVTGWLKDLLDAEKPTHELVILAITIMDRFTLADTDLYASFLEAYNNHYTSDQLRAITRLMWDFSVKQYKKLRPLFSDDHSMLDQMVVSATLLQSIYHPKNVVQINTFIPARDIAEMEEKSLKKIVEHFFDSIVKFLRQELITVSSRHKTEKERMSNIKKIQMYKNKGLERISRNTFSQEVCEKEWFILLLKNARLLLILQLSQYVHLKKKSWKELEPFFRHFSAWNEDALETYFNSLATSTVVDSVQLKPIYVQFALLRTYERLQTGESFGNNETWLHFIKAVASNKFVLDGKLKLHRKDDLRGFSKGKNREDLDKSNSEELNEEKCSLGSHSDKAKKSYSQRNISDKYEGEYTSDYEMDMPHLAAGVLKMIIPRWLKRKKHCNELFLHSCFLLNQVALKDPLYCLKVLGEIYEAHRNQIAKYNPNFFTLPFAQCLKQEPEQAVSTYLNLVQMGNVPDQIHTRVFKLVISQKKIEEFQDRILSIAGEDSNLYCCLLANIPLKMGKCVKQIESHLTNLPEFVIAETAVLLLSKNSESVIPWVNYLLSLNDYPLFKLLESTIIGIRVASQKEALNQIKNLFKLLESFIYSKRDEDKKMSVVLTYLEMMKLNVKMFASSILFIEIAAYLNRLFKEFASWRLKDMNSVYTGILIVLNACVMDFQVKSSTFVHTEFILAILNFITSSADEHLRNEVAVNFLKTCRERDLIQQFNKVLSEKIEPDLEKHLAYPEKAGIIRSYLCKWKKGSHPLDPGYG